MDMTQNEVTSPEFSELQNKDAEVLFLVVEKMTRDIIQEYQFTKIFKTIF
jgi:hypothetical protein